MSTCSSWPRTNENFSRYATTSSGARPTGLPDAALVDQAGRFLIEALTNAGYDLPADADDRKAIVNYIRQVRVTSRARVVRGSGWVGRSTYVLGSRTYGAGDEHYIADPTIDRDPARHERRGTLKAWKDEFGPLLAGNHLGITVVCAALAGPLLKLLNIESGGLQLVGTTSIGKSGFLASAASVGGPPSEGSMVTWSTTANAADDMALSRSDWALIIDETGSAGDNKQEPADVILSAIYRIAGGVEKARKHTGVGPKPVQARWRVIVVSSSELSLQELAKQSHRPLLPGQAVRFIDIPADAGLGLGVYDRLPAGVDSPQELTDRLKLAAEQNCGVALHRFLKQLVVDVAENEADLKRRLDRSIAHFLKFANVDRFDGIQIRTAMRFALIYAAGALANRYHVLPWPRREILRAISRCYSKVVKERVAARAAEEARVIELLRAFWAARHREFAEIDNYSADARRVAPPLGWLNTTKKGRREIILAPEVFRRELCSELPESTVVQVLTTRRILVRHMNGKATVQREIPDGGKGRRRFFVLDRRAMKGVFNRTVEGGV